MVLFHMIFILHDEHILVGHHVISVLVWNRVVEIISIIIIAQIILLCRLKYILYLSLKLLLLLQLLLFVQFIEHLLIFNQLLPLVFLSNGLVDYVPFVQ